MKKYYELSLSSDPKIIGVTNGIIQASFDEKCFKTIELFNENKRYCGREVLSWSKDYKLQNTKIEVDYLNILNRTKLTDIIGYSPYFIDANYIISEKFKNLLEKFSLQPSKFFKTELRKNNSQQGENYFFLFMPSIEYNDVIFSGSQVYEGHLHKKYIDLKNQEDYENNYSTAFHTFSRICLKNEYSNYDFILPKITSQWYISEDLKQAIENEGLIGMEFSNVEIVFE